MHAKYTHLRDTNSFLPSVVPRVWGGPRWQQMPLRPLSVSAGLCGPEKSPARADATFKVTMVAGDGVGPELMLAVKDVFKVLSLSPVR